ncbi:hypothetical protein [Pasteurella phage PMP-GADVASU-IND]|nr:hypothetical protein [Pasteurella phage PMP-GADVASU-IND]
MTTRKTAKDTESTTSEVAQEVLDEKGTQDNTFTAEVLGEDREFVNLIHGRQPIELAFLSNDRTAMKYLPTLVEKILGEDVLFDLMEEGAQMDDLAAIVSGWGASIKGKGSSSRK